jgi:hypothetical protein
VDANPDEQGRRTGAIVTAHGTGSPYLETFRHNLHLVFVICIVNDEQLALLLGIFSRPIDPSSFRQGKEKE